MNKNFQYTLMSITGILLMAISAGAFDSESDTYYDAEVAGYDAEVAEYDISEPGAEQSSEPLIFDNSADMDVIDAENVATNEQQVEWVDQLAAVDERYPNDMQRLEMYQSLLDESGNPYAPILLASTIVNVRNQSRDIDIFQEWLDSFGFDDNSINSLEVLANNQNINAMFLLGVYYYQVQRYEQSRDWLLQAANQQHPGAMNQLAWIYREGLGVDQDLDYAVMWHSNAAQAEYPRAMTNLAYLYSIGQGVDKDLEASANWYIRAAELNSASAIYAVATYTLNGTGGIAKNESEGVRLLMESAQLGHKRAMYVIGKRYENGDGLEFDIEQARYWYGESAKLGENDAIAALASLNY